MPIERDNSLQFVSVRLDGKNNLYWSYVMRNFLKGKNLWGYVTRTWVKPKSIDKGYVVDIDTWEAKNTKNDYLDSKFYRAFNKYTVGKV